MRTNEEKLINLLNEIKESKEQVKDLAEKLLILFGVGNCPDLSDIWNMAVDLNCENKINIFEMNNIWGALELLEKQGHCYLAPSW